MFKAGDYAIFPDDSTGLMAVVTILRAYGRVTIAQAISKYAPKEDHNKTEEYIARVASGLRMPDSTNLSTLSDEQVLRMAMVMTDVETTTKGTSWARSDPEMPVDIQQRLKR